MSIQWLPDIIVKFQAEYPSIEIRLLNGEYHEILEWLNTGKIDCGFLTKTVAQDNLFFPLVQDEMLAVVAPEKAEEIMAMTNDSNVFYDLHRFQSDSFIYPHKSHADDVAQIFKQQKIKPNIRFEVKGDEAILALISKNLGVGILPKLYLDSSRARVKTLPLDPPQYRIIGLAFSAKYDRLPITDIFTQWIKNWLANSSSFSYIIE